MTTSYTTKLRPLSERMGNGVAKTKGFSGNTQAPWRQQKKHPTGRTKTRQVGGVTVTRYERKAQTEKLDDTSNKYEKQWENQLPLEVTPQTKPVAYDQDAVGHGVSAWYVVERIEGFTHATTEEREEVVREQVKCFGKTGIRRHAKACTKWEKKEQALDNALRLAFNPRPQTASDNALSLDPNREEDDGQTWVPLTANPLQEMAGMESVAWTYKQLEEGLNTLTAKQHMALTERAEGMPQTDRRGEHLKAAQRKMRQTLGL